MDRARRSSASEHMDDPDLDPATYARCLADLATVNVVTMTHRPTMRFLARATKTLTPGTTLRILDVASGHGDLLRAIHRWATGAGFVPVLSGLDLNPRSALVAAAATPETMQITWRTGNVFDDTPQPAPDFIVTSQFTHHLLDGEVIAFLQWIDRHAKTGWCIVDLQRHILAWWGFQALARIAFWHRIVREDGLVSIARGFHREEWQSLLAQARVDARIEWSPLFRLTVSRLK